MTKYSTLPFLHLRLCSLCRFSIIQFQDRKVQKAGASWTERMLCSSVLTPQERSVWWSPEIEDNPNQRIIPFGKHLVSLIELMTLCHTPTHARAHTHACTHARCCLYLVLYWNEEDFSWEERGRSLLWDGGSVKFFTVPCISAVWIYSSVVAQWESISPWQPELTANVYVWARWILLFFPLSLSFPHMTNKSRSYPQYI